MSGKVGIVGGGLIGLASAYYLKEFGFEVEIISKGTLEESCSYANAGMITPSHFIPLSAPGILAQSTKWLLQKDSPLYIKPRLNSDLIRWSYHFLKSSRRKYFESSASALSELLFFSKERTKELINKIPHLDQMQEKGIIMLFKTAHHEKEEIETMHKAEKMGLKVKFCDNDDLSKLYPKADLNAKGGIHYLDDAHLVPEKFTQVLKEYIVSSNIPILDSEVMDFDIKDNKVHSVFLEDGNKKKYDHIILAAGSWTGLLAKKLGKNIPLQGGKGYSVSFAEKEVFGDIPFILTEAKIAATPMKEFYRLAGTMEIVGLKRGINNLRINSILQNTKKYFSNFRPDEISKVSKWYGFRPVSSDGLPYIGQSNIKNAWITTGHAMMGLGLAAGTGLLITELISGQKPSMSVDSFDPLRFS
jgi:D-amino-acid dehydrogenase